MVFLDTPGIHKTRTSLHESMVQSALAAFYEVDILLLMVEMGRAHDQEIGAIMATLRRVKRPSILAINKIDKGPKDLLLPIIEGYSRTYPFHEIVPISALRGDGLEALLEALKSRLEPGPRFFPEDMTTDVSEGFLISEIIREKVYSHTRKELPYSSAVTVDRLEERSNNNLLSISARIHVETDSQKRILIGRGGRMIKAIGQTARLELEKIFGLQVYLDLMVRVEKNWSRDTRALRRLGY